MWCVMVDHVIPRLYGNDGIWMFYEYNLEGCCYVVRMVSDSAARVARAQATSGYGKVGFWPLNMTIEDAVKWWEELE